MREQARLEAVRALAVLDTPAEPAFDDLTLLARSIAGVPTALISVMDAERQWFKSRVGLDVCSTSRAVAFCDFVVRSEQELEVVDATVDVRFTDNPLVTGPPGIVSYAGFPLAMQDGLVIGTLCVIGYEPQALDDEQRRGLRVLARQVVTQLELRRLTAEQAAELDQRRRVEDELATSRRQYRLLADHSTDIISRHRPDGSVTYVSPAVLDVLGYSPQEEISKDAKNHVHLDDLEVIASALSAVAQGEKATVIVRCQHADGSWRHLEVTLSPLVDPNLGVVEVYSAARDVTDRVAAAQTLERSLGLIQAVLDNVPVGIVACDELGRLTLFNPASREFHGLNADANIDAADWADRYALYQPDGVTPLAPEDIPLRQALAGEQVQDVEIVIAPNGLPARLMSCTGQDLRGSSGQLMGAVVTMTDITAVRESEQRLGTAYGLLTDANRRLRERSEADALIKTIAVAANEASSMEAALQVGLDAVCRHTGLPVGHVYRVSDEAKGVAQPANLWHLDNPRRFSAFKRATETAVLGPGRGLPGRVVATRTPAWIADVRLDPDFPQCAGGEELGVRAAFAVPLLAGSEVIGVLEFFSDRVLPLDQDLLDLISEVGVELGRVAERKRGEDALRYSEERTRSILSAANEAFVGMDEDGLITDWNPSAEAIFGWSVEEVLGRSLAGTIIPAPTRQAHEQGLRHYLATGEGPVLGRRIEVTALRRDRSEFPAELSIWSTTTGVTSAFNAFVQDITERKRNQQDLAEAHDKAMEASRLKSQFLATMSHEIRTPLNGVIGLSELLLDTELAGQQRPYAEGLRTAGHTLLAVVNDILDFSKIEAGKLELEEVDFDPRRLVEDVLGLLTGSADAKGLRLVGTCSPDLPTALWGDPVRLRQILLNLTSNAVKFTEAGEVVVRVERDSPLTADRVTMALTVTDSGIGIAPSDQARILEPFSQADASTTRRFGGTGLGLAICRQLAKAMGGTLSLSSQPCQGSTFRVTVPLGWHQSSEASPPPAQPTAVPATADVGGGLILVVDDNSVNQMVATAMLTKLGYVPETVSDGRQAVAAVAHTHYVVVLMDCHMPVMDGYEAARAIRAGEGAGQRVPIIAMTANVRTEDWDRCVASGMDDHVSKPFTLATLERALSHWTTPGHGLDRPLRSDNAGEPLLALQAGQRTTR